MSPPPALTDPARPADAALPRWLRLAPAVIVLWIVTSWPIGLALDPKRLTRPGEIAYLLADVGILLPVALAAALALHRRSPSSHIILVAMLGALAYDATHFAVRTAQELSTTAARLAVTAGLGLLLATIVLGLRLALGAQRPTPAPSHHPSTLRR